MTVEEKQKRRVSDAVIISIISGIVTIITMWMTITLKGSVSTVKENLQDVHQQINSRMDELLKTTKEASRAKGFMEGSGTIDSSTTEMDSSKVYKILPVK